MRTTKTMMKITRPIVCAGLLASLLAPPAIAQAKQSSPAIALPSDADIRSILVERVNALAGADDGIGIVVGLVGPQGRKVISYGHLNQRDSRPLNGDTVFEIGSVSKVFTALLLAEMVEKGEVALADPASKYLPNVRLPTRNGHSISLVDLVTHTSGLPFMPDELPAYNLSAANKNSDAPIYQFLKRFQLTRNPGAEWDYSNLDYWLLSQALASRAGTDYEHLLHTRVIAPLKMASTAINPSPRMKERLAVGHNVVLQPAPAFADFSIYAAMPAAGGLVSTVNDMLTFLSVAVGYERSPLSPAMAALMNTRRPLDDESKQALGWVITGKGNDELVTHEGSTWGYSSYVAFDPQSRVGVVVLSNQLESVSDIAHHLLRPNFPLTRPVMTKHTEIALDSSFLDAYAGQYEAEGVGVFNVDREHDDREHDDRDHADLNHNNRGHDFLAITLPPDWGLPKFRLRPESSRDFFVDELPVRVTFQADANGRANGMLVYPPRGQHALPAKRITPVK